MLMAPGPVDDFVFRVPGPLLGWMRPSHHYGGVHDPPEQVAYKKMVALICKIAMRERGIFTPLQGPVSLSFNAVFPHPQRATPRRHWKDSRPDLDNLIKNIKDALKGIAWVDDQQVAHYGRCAKCFMPPGMSGQGYAWVTIERPPDHEYPFLEDPRPAGAVPGDARLNGPKVEGRTGQAAEEGDGGAVDAGPAQHPADGGVRKPGRPASVRRGRRRRKDRPTLWHGTD
jgi:Holliday junction resolvase RusA-like endonuclease